MAYKVKTNLDRETVHDLLLDTYTRWVEFALGKNSINGKMLKHPSGKAAAAITAERDAEGYVIGIYFEGTEASKIEYGHRPVDLKKLMLAGRTSRVINFRDKPASPTSIVGRGGIRTIRAAIQSGGRPGLMRVTGPLRFYKNIGRIWAQAAEAHTDRFRTMSNKPGSAKWIIPAMPAFSAMSILRSQLPQKLRDKVRLPSREYYR
jgi:hypothetical protein